jgi:hypothetical protein
LVLLVRTTQMVLILFLGVVHQMVVVEQTVRQQLGGLVVLALVVVRLVLLVGIVVVLEQLDREIAVELEV